MKAAIVALAVAGVGAGTTAASAEGPAGRILVMPFENVSHENRIVWLGEASAVLLVDDLNAFGMNAITREERRAAFNRLQVPRTASLTDATVIRIGQLVGASMVVVGTLQLDGDSLVARARAIALDAGRVQSDVTERAPMADLFVVFERLARRILSPTESGGGGAGPVYPSIGAFENYIKGLLAETPATAVRYLSAALAADPKFNRARLALWEQYDDQDLHERALAAVSAIPPSADVARRARFLAGISQIHLRRYDAAFATFKALADNRATAAVLNNLGVVQLRRGGPTTSGSPAYFFDKAAQADSTDPDYFFNLGYAYWSERDLPTAIYWLREAVRRDPADGDAHYVLGAALSASGSPTEANREKELARRLSSTYSQWERRPAADPVPKGLERLKRDVELPQGPREDALTGQRDQQELARFYLDRGRRLFQGEQDREALTDLNRTLFLSPYQAEAHLLIGRIHLRGGRIREAVDALKISLWSAETADAHAVLAAALLESGDADGARAEAQRTLDLDPQSTEAKRTLDAIPPR
jgi:tetratricopeptide (TPR) repeat protein